MVEENWSSHKNIQGIQNIELLRQFGTLRDFAAVPTRTSGGPSSASGPRGTASRPPGLGT
jgi:hypothetical protein